jgi:hypothetical protein
MEDFISAAFIIGCSRAIPDKSPSVGCQKQGFFSSLDRI